MSFSNKRFRNRPHHLIGASASGEQDELAMMELSGNHNHDDSMLSEESFLGSHIFDSPKTKKNSKKNAKKVVVPGKSIATSSATTDSTSRRPNSGTASNPIDIDSDGERPSSKPHKHTTATTDGKKPSCNNAAAAASEASKKPTFRPVKLPKSKSSKSVQKQAPKETPASVAVANSNAASMAATAKTIKGNQSKKGRRKKKGHPTTDSTAGLAVNRQAVGKNKAQRNQNSNLHRGANDRYLAANPVGSSTSAARLSSQKIPQQDNLGAPRFSAVPTDDLYADLPDAFHDAKGQWGDPSAASNPPNGKKRKIGAQHATGADPDATFSSHVQANPNALAYRGQNKRQRGFDQNFVRTRQLTLSTPDQNLFSHRQSAQSSSPHVGRGGVDPRSLSRKLLNGEWGDNNGARNFHQYRKSHEKTYRERGQPPYLQEDSFVANADSRIEALKKQIEMEAKKKIEQETELRVSAENKAKAAETKTQATLTELESLRQETFKLKADIEVKTKALDKQRVDLQAAKCNAEAQAVAQSVEAESRRKEVGALKLEVKSLTSEVEKVKKNQDRMRLRLQKESERKVAIEAKALADVTQKLQEEQQARAETLKVAIEKSEEAKRKTEEVETLKNEIASMKSQAESMKTAALNGLLQMQEDSKRRAEVDAQQIAQLAHALRQEEEARLAATAEASAKSAEAEKLTKEAAVLHQTIDELKAKAALNKHSEGVDEKIVQLANHLDACTGPTNGATIAAEGGKKMSSGSSKPPRPTFRPKKVKKICRSDKKTKGEEKKRKEETTTCSAGKATDSHVSEERRFVFSDDRRSTETSSSSTASTTTASFTKSQNQGTSKPKPFLGQQSDEGPKFSGLEENSDAALKEQERLLNASKARMRTQQAKQARVLPGHDKLQATSIPKNKTFAALIRDVHIEFPDHWQYKSLYARLGLPRSAPDAMIKSQYRKLAKQYHPDRNSHSEESKKKFQAVTEAYEILMHKH